MFFNGTQKAFNDLMGFHLRPFEGVLTLSCHLLLNNTYWESTFVLKTVLFSCCFTQLCFYIYFNTTFAGSSEPEFISNREDMFHFVFSHSKKRANTHICVQKPIILP